MSYDIDLEINTGGPQTAHVYEVGNYTSNVSGMWRDALGISLSALAGRVAGEVVPDLNDAISDMESRPEHFRAMEPSNGWGTYEGALEYLRKLREGCQRHPKTTIWISC